MYMSCYSFQYCENNRNFGWKLNEKECAMLELCTIAEVKFGLVTTT